MDNNKIFPLEKVKSMVDLGVRFDTNLMFRDHISEKINKAYSILGIIKRNFIYRKTSDSSRVPYTSRAPDTGRGLKWIVPIEAGGFYPRFYGIYLTFFNLPRPAATATAATAATA